MSINPSFWTRMRMPSGWRVNLSWGVSCLHVVKHVMQQHEFSEVLTDKQVPGTTSKFQLSETDQIDRENCSRSDKINSCALPA